MCVCVVYAMYYYCVRYTERYLVIDYGTLSKLIYQTCTTHTNVCSYVANMFVYMVNICASDDILSST